jgi:hypothetical protein
LIRVAAESPDDQNGGLFFRQSDRAGLLEKATALVYDASAFPQPLPYQKTCGGSPNGRPRVGSLPESENDFV